MDPMQVSNILGMDLTTVDDSFPLIKDKSLVPFRVVSGKVETTKDGEGSNVVLVYETTAPCSSSKDKVMNPGVKLFERVGITPKGDRTVEMILQQLKKVRKGLTGSPTGDFGDPAQYVGVEFLAEVGISTDKTGQWPDSNRIRKYVPRA